MQRAREYRDKAIEQGATLCDECGGEGGTIHGVCIACYGQGLILPPDGLRLNAGQGEGGVMAELKPRAETQKSPADPSHKARISGASQGGKCR